MSEGLVMDYEDNQFYISFWQQGFQLRATSWKEKLRWIWHIIKTGEFWTDQVILNKEVAVEVANDILKKVNDDRS